MAKKNIWYERYVAASDSYTQSLETNERLQRDNELLRKHIEYQQKELRIASQNNAALYRALEDAQKMIRVITHPQLQVSINAKDGEVL